MQQWRELLVPYNVSIYDAIKVIDRTGRQIVVVVGEGEQLLGTVSDGDIRRAILGGIQMDRPVVDIMNASPTRVHAGREDRELSELGDTVDFLRVIPIVDTSDRIIGIIGSDEHKPSTARPNAVVIMAGGLGARLRPLTDSLPKPMLPVGNKPILETIIDRLIVHGFKRYFISVNYKADIIRSHFADGAGLGVEVRYLNEVRPLGTCGSLSLLPERPDEPVLVLNGDVLTDVDFAALMDFHRQTEAVATMCVRESDMQVPYGVVRLEGHEILGIEEKPVFRHIVNSGIYVLSPEAIRYVPPNEPMDMPELFGCLVAQGLRTVAFPIREYWIDVGRIDDYKRANGDMFDAKRPSGKEPK